MFKSLFTIGLFVTVTSLGHAQHGMHAGGGHSGSNAFNGLSAPLNFAPIGGQSSSFFAVPPVSPILNHWSNSSSGYGFRNFGYGGFGGYGLGYGGYGGYGLGYGGYGYSPSNININYNLNFPQPYIPPRNFAPAPPVPNDHPASALLTLQAPNGAEVWLNGEKVEGSANRTFESPILRRDEPYTFDLRVTWREQGKTVEEKRTLTMKAGEHQSLQVHCAAALVGATARLSFGEPNCVSNRVPSSPDCSRSLARPSYRLQIRLFAARATVTIGSGSPCPLGWKSL